MKSVELFAGAGGLAMGVARAGFHHEAVIEWDADSVETLRRNQRKGVKLVSPWPIIQADVAGVDFKAYEGKLDLISGGPPCQPFSLGGKHKGHEDARNMFPDTFRALREARPRAFIFENVKGLMRRTFADYFEYIVLQLTYPEVQRKGANDWRDHLAELERVHTKGGYKGLTYKVVFRLLNAANYGVPQRRERVFFVGIRSDQQVEWTFPQETHSRDALLVDQWVTADYWDRHRVAKKDRPQRARGASHVADRVAEAPNKTAPWATVRDAISDLPDPTRKSRESLLVLNHVFNPGARSYPGHTGSPLDEPAKTLKAGDHGVPGGENMVRMVDGSVRYFTVRESARLQTFPDEYDLNGTWTETMRQLGNAVPMKLAQVVATSLRNALKGSNA
ncbi:MAG: DNA cytosine methyltransferase [Planctomycetota bacterium]|nr:DNA cytosine methyltransferase [Planctomycetota bacterium]